MSPKSLRNSFIYVMIALAAIVMFFTFIQPSYSTTDIPISEVVELAKAENLQTIEIHGDNLTIITTTGNTFQSRKEEGSSLVETLERANIDTAATGLEIVTLDFLWWIALVHDETGPRFWLPNHEFWP